MSARKGKTQSARKTCSTLCFCNREHRVLDKERAKSPNTYKPNIFQESSWQAYLWDWDHSFTLVITASRIKKTLFWEVSPNTWTKGRGIPNYFSKYFSVPLLLSGWNHFHQCMFQKCIVGIGGCWTRSEQVIWECFFLRKHSIYLFFPLKYFQAYGRCLTGCFQ